MERKNKPDSLVAVAEALQELAAAQREIAAAIRDLGFAGHGKDPGIGEAIVLSLRDGLDHIANAISEHS
jgi:hypothetical protein